MHLRFGLPPHPRPALKAKIKAADRIAAYFESVSLAGFSIAEAKRFFGEPNGVSIELLPIEPMPTALAQQRFLDRFGEIETARTELQKTARKAAK